MSFNHDNFTQVMNAIRANPNAWIQSAWHAVEVDEEGRAGGTYSVGPLKGRRFFRNPAIGECATAHCVAGWAQVLSGHEQDSARALKEAAEWLGLQHLREHDGLPCWPWLFRPGRTWEDLLAVEQGRRDPMTGFTLYPSTEHR